MTRHSALQGLYVITDHNLCQQHNMSVVEMAEAAIRGGAQILQYRNKASAHVVQAQEAAMLAALCRANDVVFLINDDVELALSVQADGVHVGQGDTALLQARKRLGPKRIIGVTCHDQLALAQTAQANGADYVAFGRFFPSKTKPQAPPAEIDILRQAKSRLAIPIAAIGGITPGNAVGILRHGADMLAVVHGVFGAADIEAAADEYARLFTLQSSRTNDG